MDPHTNSKLNLSVEDDGGRGRSLYLFGGRYDMDKQITNMMRIDYGKNRQI